MVSCCPTMFSSWRASALVGLLALADSALAIGQSTCVAFKSTPSTFPIVSRGKGTPILLSADDWPGVQRAAFDFAADIQRVTGVKPSIANATTTSRSKVSSAIIVGTLGKSSLIDAVVNNTKLDVSSIQGKWEAFLTKEVKNPLPGIDSAYLIIGADKRGSIFSLYDHSEQFGQFVPDLSTQYSRLCVDSHRRFSMVLVSDQLPKLLPVKIFIPCFRWADVTTTKHSELFVTSAGCSHGSPSVKFRGIFLNDEQPALQNWAMEKFTNGTGAPLTGSPFNSLFYTKL